MLDRGEAVRKLVLNLAGRSGLAPLASRYLAGRGAILMLHRVNRAPEQRLGVNRHLTVKPEFLDMLIGDMKASGYVFVSMDETLDRLKAGPGGERFATITLDDGYRDNLSEALPVFEKHQTPFTVYVSPGLTAGTTDLWWDVLEDIVLRRDRLSLPTPLGDLAIDSSTMEKKIAANARIHDYLTTEVPEQEQRAALHRLAHAAGLDCVAYFREALMNWDEIRHLSRHPLATIGAHSVNHYNLKRLPAEQALGEIADTAGLIEAETGIRPRHFAYPYGYAQAVGAREVALAAEAGYASAVTTRHGLLQAEHAFHLHALPRISVNGRYQQVEHLRTMLSGITTPLANAGRRVVTV